MKNKRNNRRKAGRIITAILTLSFIASCMTTTAFAYDADGKFDCTDDITSRPMAQLEGSTYAVEANRIGNLDDLSLVQEFNSEVDSIQALRNGKVDSVINSYISSIEYVKTYDDIMIFPEPVGEVSYAIGFPKGSALREEFNTALAQLNAEGMSDELYEKWYINDYRDAEPLKQDWTGEKGTLQYWLNVGPPPTAYISGDGELVGYTVDLVYMVCREMGYNVELTECNFSGLIPALKSGDADMAGRSMVVTEERKKSIDFSDPFLITDIVLTVRKEDVSQSILDEYGIEADKDEDFISSLKDSFYSTFIAEDRWKLFAEGIGTTLLITVASAVLGTVLGFLMYLLFRRGYKWVNSILLTLNKWISGIPVVVFLMVMFYIIFKKSILGGIGISIVTFTIIFGISVFGLIRSGVDTIGIGQDEAATALGFTPFQTLMQIILPQAILNMMPLYRSTLVGHLKNTSIVGYIAIQDLTKMSDLVRSRTFEAFFPLIATAIIYYLLGSILDAILAWLERKIQPGNRKSTMLKGVKLR